MKSKLHLNYSVSSSFAFTAKEKTIDCKEDPRKKSKYLKKKGEIIKKGAVLQKILEINRTFKSNEHLCLLPSPGVVISAYTFESTTPEEGQEKGKGSIELLCTLVPAGIRYPCVVYSVER